MDQLAHNLFREVAPDFFRVLSSPLAGLYVDILDAVERETSQVGHAINREEAVAIAEQAIEAHDELGDITDEEFAVEGTHAKARSLLEVLFRSGWLHEERRSDWQRLVYFDSNGGLLIQALRKIAFPDAAVFSDKVVNVCATLANRTALTQEPWPQIESCVANLQVGLSELRGMEKSIERHTKEQLAGSSLKDNLSVVFDRFAEQIGKTCYTQLVQSRLPSRLADARQNINDIENDMELLTRMQTEVMRREPQAGPETALANVRTRLDDLHGLLDQVIPLADEIDRRTADFTRRSQARFRYLQETTSENRARVQTFFEILSRRFAGLRIRDIEELEIGTPTLLLHEVQVPSGVDSLYSPRLRRLPGENEPLDDSSAEQRDRTLAQLQANIRDSLTVSRANRFVASLPGKRGASWNSADLLRDHVHNDEDVGHLIACILHAQSSDARFEIRVPRHEQEADLGEIDYKLRYGIERFIMVKK